VATVVMLAAVTGGTWEDEVATAATQWAQ